MRSRKPVLGTSIGEAVEEMSAIEDALFEEDGIAFYNDNFQSGLRKFTYGAVFNLLKRRFPNTSLEIIDVTLQQICTGTRFLEFGQWTSDTTIVPGFPASDMGPGSFIELFPRSRVKRCPILGLVLKTVPELDNNEVNRELAHGKYMTGDKGPWISGGQGTYFDGETAPTTLAPHRLSVIHFVLNSAHKSHDLLAAGYEEVAKAAAEETT